MFLPIDTITLTDVHLDWAVEQSQTATTEADQWQHYLNAVARAGMEQWLEKRSPELLPHQEGRNRTDLCHLTIGNFRLYLIATDSLEDIEIPLSPSVLETPFLPHFYVLIQVFEELQQIRVRGYIPQAQLIQALPSNPSATEDEPYWLPITCFDLNPDRLLLSLRCLEPAAIAENVSVTAPSSPLATAAINVGLWLQNQVDRLAAELSWVLLPPLTLNPALGSSLRGSRSAIEEFESVLTDLVQRSPIEIPPEARGAYQDIELANLPLRLYAATWQITGAVPEWTLLVVLGTRAGTLLPNGIRLQVRDAEQVLEDVALGSSGLNYLYACVIGSVEESFWVTISLPNGTATTLPPFIFSRDTQV
ncbi:DUF1822 family protein [Leptolyngbya ohadii]|uniref:DUF1822 family protein n=1 Tax=Leptolyngbya ohadii TaxID=1962290 RepID=UPI0015C69083|nr:DUF1822 family protein [Leptolyngbya ohadii]